MTRINQETPVATATRIAAGDDGTNYDNVAVTLHWLTAMLVVVLFGMAITWDDFPHATAETMQSIHVSLGVLLTAVIIARIGWRLMPGHQISSLEVGWVRLASKGVHYLLYALLVAQAALGFLFRWAQGHPVSFFGLFDIGSPLGAVAKPTRHTIHFLHEKAGWAIVLLALGHALAALYHHYALKDRVLERMLPSARKRV
jgi:cytochrome b561